ncbi:hypothetical protein NHH03_23480 [Stieleria sp. TO1_6]|uniref:hypothetical protein n=1 Tax=Stieleria tagensis TaxID=2956795 RepID=UPI00209A93D5|nr:hypothetical protein [Stieleria tagensis]MCO8124721.1 hypothetical protein [Stieleria tagensis]
MRLPPWAIEAIRNGVADVARKASDAETISKVKEQAAELLRDLPENASRGLDSIVKTATDTARGAVDQGRQTVLRWTERQTDLTVPCQNASGELLSKQGSGVPISDHVLQVGCDILRGDCVDLELRDRLNQSLARMADLEGHQVAVAHNFDAAIAALGILANNRSMVMHRSQAIRLPSGMPLPDALPGVSLKQCGGVQAIETDDFDGIDNACVLLADNGVQPISPIDFGRADVMTVAITPVATIKDSIAGVPSAQSLLQSGVDLVVLAGGPITGGVAAGILVGDKTLVDSIRRDQRWKALVASPATAAMTLAAMTDPEPSPVSALVQTAEENLRSRAERMAMRLTADESVAACQITDQPACLVTGGRWNFPSRQLRLRHKTLSPEAWAARLIKQNPAMITSVIGDQLVIDLRWIAASRDGEVADTIETCQ